MLPDSVIQAPDFNMWLTGVQASSIMKVYPSNIGGYVLRYNVANQIMFGRRMYYLPDCERAAKAIAQMRAERDGVPQS